MLAVLIFGLTACGGSKSVTEISLGDNLPVWALDVPHTSAEINDIDREQGIIGKYLTESDAADVYVYSFPKTEGDTLEDFGQRLASEHNVFCNMMTDRNIPVAVLNYYECIEEEPYIVQAYIYEADESFVEVCTMFKMEKVSINSENIYIRMIKEYEAQANEDSPLIFDSVYRTENERLPQLRIRQFYKNSLPVEIIDPDLAEAVSDEEYAAFAEDGWTLEEILSLYDESYDLFRGDVVCRNNLDLAFIAYTDEGVFKTRAIIDDENTYVMLSAEDEASKFQHVTNALIDAIGKK